MAECNTLFEAAYQCFLKSNTFCSGCIESAYEKILASSDSVDCVFYEDNFCSAIMTCDCLACQKEIELAYSCGQPSCEPYDCSRPTLPPNSTNITPGSNISLAPVNENPGESESEEKAISPFAIVGPVAAICLIVFIALSIRRRQVCERSELKFFPSKEAHKEEHACEELCLSRPQRPANLKPRENQMILEYDPSNSGLTENAPDIVSGRREHNTISLRPAPAFVSNVELYQPAFKDQTRTVDRLPIPFAVEVSPQPEATPYRNRLDP
jgi:hypothetical protein